MTLQKYQAALSQLVIDPEFRDRLRRHGEAELPGELTRTERDRLLAAACAPGIEMMRTLHKGFRLGKLLSLLPLTCTLLGDEPLADEVDAFWKTRPAMSFYYIEEAMAFCHHLRMRINAGLSIQYLREIVSYECAGLHLQRAVAPDESDDPQLVSFEHDPSYLIEALSRGEQSVRAPVHPCVLLGTRVGQSVRWRLVDDESVTHLS